MKKVKDVVRITGLSRRTLHYYDEIGIVKAQRTTENYRIYGESEMRKLWNLIIYKTLGFRLCEIKLLLNGKEDESEIILEKRLKELQQEIDKLSQIYDFTEKLAKHKIPKECFNAFCEKNETYKESALRIVYGSKR